MRKVIQSDKKPQNNKTKTNNKMNQTQTNPQEYLRSLAQIWKGEVGFSCSFGYV